VAVNIWRSKDRGLYSEIQGAEDGGSVRYIGGLTTTQHMMVLNITRRYKEIVQ
jgi:hypothetical protein